MSDRFAILSVGSFWTGSGWSDDSGEALAFSAPEHSDPWLAADGLARKLSKREGRPCVVCFLHQTTQPVL